MLFKGIVSNTGPLHTQLTGKLQQVQADAVDHHRQQAHDDVQPVTDQQDQDGGEMYTLFCGCELSVFEANS